MSVASSEEQIQLLMLDDLADRPSSEVGQAHVTDSLASAILTKATGFMGAYDFTLNPYSGCGFGCTYCYAAFFARDAERRDNWGYWVDVKQNAVELLSRPRQQAKLDGARIYMSSVTDAYQPVERRLKLTRQLLEIMAFGGPVEADVNVQASMFAEPPTEPYGDGGHAPKLVVQTRSPHVTRDIDLFQRIESNGGRVQINMTVTTDNEDVRKRFEPSCPANQRRIDAIQEVHEAGVQACVTLTPLIWTDDPHAFASRLLDTGIERFIIQPFKFTGGKFVAQTREGALKLMAELLECQPHPKVIEREYMKHYRVALATFHEMLPNLGEEKAGFAPPF